MLVIRQAQMDVFKEAALASFENEMVAHSQEFSPKLCKVIGEERVRLVVRNGITRAGGYGFTNRGPIRLYIEMMFLFGSGFDSDPQYPWAGSILRDSTEQMARAERLYEQVLDYQEKVSGPDGVNTIEALRSLPLLAHQPLEFSSSNFVTGMLREMANIFPKKAAYVGEEGLRGLIRESCEVAKGARFSTSRGYTLMVALMYAFGHGCADDLLYPWLSNTLTDERIVDSLARAERLERKALTWLDHVLNDVLKGISE